MKKILIGSFVVIATMNLGCEKRIFEYTTTVNQSAVYTVNDVGTFTKSAVITRASVAKAFSLPADAKVTQLQIESLSLRVDIGAGNQALTMRGTGTKIPGGFMFQDFPIALGALDPDKPFVGLNTLIEDGIGKLKSEIEGWVKGSGTTSQLTIELKGVSFPANSRMVFTISLEIKASIKYEQCEMTFRGTGGAACGSSAILPPPPPGDANP